MNQSNKRIMSLVFTLTIVTLLYFSGPSAAIDAVIDKISDIFKGQIATIAGNITLNDYEFIMTSGTVNLTITNASGSTVQCSLPLTTGTFNNWGECTNNQHINVVVSSSNWGQGYGYGYDYGYAYNPPAMSYQYGYGYAYQYGYSYLWQGTAIRYTVTWAVPLSYGSGIFTAVFKVYADNTEAASSTTETFTVKSLADLPRGAIGARISEILPHSTNDSASKPNGEWVEMQNTKTASLNVSGWKIVNSIGTEITITGARTNTGSTVIPGKGFLAVYMNAPVLDDSADSVSLYHSNGTLIDVFSYNAAMFAGSPFVEQYTYAPLLATGYRFKAGASLIISEASAEECTGLFIDGSCYEVTNESTPGESNPGMEETFTKDLAQVWNLISIPLTVDNTTVQGTLSSMDGKYSIVWGYNASDTSDPWKKFVPGAAVGNDLSDMGVSWGYWVRVNATSATLNITGDEPSSTDIPLVQVWNLVGYPKLTSQNVTTALASISGNYTIVWGYNASDTSDPWKKYVPGAAVGNDLDALTPGSGYWIRVNVSSETLTI